jgi:hypothetical protein
LSTKLAVIKNVTGVDLIEKAAAMTFQSTPFFRIKGLF